MARAQDEMQDNLRKAATRAISSITDSQKLMDAAHILIQGSTKSTLAKLLASVGEG